MGARFPVGAQALSLQMLFAYCNSREGQSLAHRELRETSVEALCLTMCLLLKSDASSTAAWALSRAGLSTGGAFPAAMPLGQAIR